MTTNRNSFLQSKDINNYEFLILASIEICKYTCNYLVLKSVKVHKNNGLHYISIFQ